MKSVLITYYSKTGSTKEVAEKLQQKLIEMGETVEVKAFTEVENLSNYHTVVIGAPINGFKWVPEAESFMKAHEAELTQKFVSTFCLSYLSHYPRPFFRKMIKNNYEKAARQFSPIQTAVFGGIGAQELPAFIRMIFGVPSHMPKDTRDWPTIEHYAENLGKALQMRSK